jgi:hypothetical protein
MRGLLQSLAPLKPKLILLAVDGSRKNRTNDAELVRQTQELASEITWDTEIRTRFRDSNLGLRGVVVDAVTWANSEYGRVIVLENDVRAEPQLLDFLNYNLVPEEHLCHPDHASRLSVYPESYAWATWDRAWRKYDDDITWAKNASLGDMKKICGSTAGALRWKLNFSDASAERIDTWAYRWLASMWANNLKGVSSNRNVSQYKGFEGGTHKRRQMKWSELEIEQLPTSEGKINNIGVDKLADRWLARNIFKSTTLGVIEGTIISIVLTIIRKVKSK